tara:strand:- start:2 stop:451 length:450 start_codon:yes stop_codon:yes gene_type:complete
MEHNMEQEYKIEDIVTAIRDKEPIEVEKAFSDVLSSKLKGALDTKKQELAKAVFSPDTKSEDDGEDSTDEDEEADIDESDRFTSSDKTKKSDRKKNKKKREKWLKTSGGKKYSRNQEKRQDKVKKGTVKVDKKRSKQQKSISKAYKNER